MKALVCQELSDDLSGTALIYWPEPEPGPGEVKVFIKAASINFPDILMCHGKYQFRPDLPFVVGMEVSGVVVSCGEGVTDFHPGDRVVGGGKTGGFAQYGVFPAKSLRPLPTNFDYAQGSAYGSAYLTAYVSLVRRGQLQPGETLLVHGASGGVGMAAIDVGKRLGATVIATTGSKQKISALRSHGADHVLDLSDGFREQVKALTGGKGADVIFDPIGGDVFDESVRCVNFDGRLLVIGFMSGRIAEVKTNMPLIKGFSVVGVRAGEYGRRFPERGQENLETIWNWAAEETVAPHIHARLPLAEAKAGMQMLIDRKVVGKLVIET